MWPYMCMCCGLFVPTQFHFECCGVLDDSWWDICLQILSIDTFERLSWCLCLCLWTWKCFCICMDGEASLKRAASFSLSSFSVSLFVSLSPRRVWWSWSWLWLWWWRREEKENWIDKSNHLVADSRQSFPPYCWNWTVLSGKANDWRNRRRVVLDLFSNLKMGKIQGVNLWSTW